jgi:hypothetical protein
MLALESGVSHKIWLSDPAAMTTAARILMRKAEARKH